jgi:hypothetical protein
VALVRLPRRDDDVDAAERPAEAAWISEIIERNGGVAPALLVEEVLELHRAYLRQARPPVPADPAAGTEAWAYPPPAPGAIAPGSLPAGYAPPGYRPPPSPPPASPPPVPLAPGSLAPGSPPPPGQPGRPMPPTRR